jgi:hypothetical protein
LALLAPAGVVSEKDEPVAQLVAEALRMALEEVTQSNQPWEPGWTLVVIDAGDELVATIVPAKVVAQCCPWLNEQERAAIVEPLPIDQRQTVLYIQGYTACARYIVPGGRASN